VSSSFAFDVGAASTSARLYRGEGAKVTLVLAPGAGAPQAHPWMVKMAQALAALALDVVTFDFLYAAARRRAPDKNDVLEATWRAAVDAVRARTDVAQGRLFIGGKSMGGRIATQVAAHPDVDVAGVVLLGYPLHPPGKPQQLRTAHLPKVRAPMLFVQGSRDAFGTPAELAPHIEPLREAQPATRLFVVEGGDHSLARPKSSGESLDSTLQRVAGEVARWVSALSA
jgi:predicted alpha/beta-hydrolase family hydrolase